MIFNSDSSSNTHIVSGGKIEKLIQELNNCTYFEASVTSGLNVDLVFREGIKFIFKTIFELS